MHEQNAIPGLTNTLLARIATRTLAAYPKDTFSDVLTVDGVAMHYLNAEAIQIALGELYPVAARITPKAG